MKIQIATGDIDNPQLVREFMHRKVQLALARIDAEVERVEIRLDNENGGSGSFCGSCRIEATLMPEGQVQVSAEGQSAFECVLQAVRKLEGLIKRDFDRQRITKSRDKNIE